MSNYRNANPNASPYVLVTSEDIPMATPKNTTQPMALLMALGSAKVERGRAIRIYNDGRYLCSVTVDK